ncbi:MAG: redoxin domain-containing protein [Acidobacteriia bacterium]|nr:redoxin domain-containing protein [Terriglobia bacterium]MYG01032.1 redoxin domain-containing protein [Terriglobia bacterium]MYK12351.1 redoxin domain-containing protein [Terriglobia bacterium]
MQGYQAGIQTFTDSGAVVFAISTDPLDTNKKFAESLSLEFAILSDEGGAVSKKFGVLNERNMSNRTTFVIGKDGKIAHVESGSGAIDPAGAAAACSKL